MRRVLCVIVLGFALAWAAAAIWFSGYESGWREGRATMNECDTLPSAEARAICHGTATFRGRPLAPHVREFNLRRYIAQGLLPADFVAPGLAERGPCRHGGTEVVGTVICDLCGGEKGQEFPLLACAIHGTCTERKLRRHGVAACKTCEQHEPP